MDKSAKGRNDASKPQISILDTYVADDIITYAMAR